MNTYFSLLLQGAALIGAIVLILWFILIKSEKKYKLKMRDASLTSEELDDYAKKIATRHSISKKKSFLNWPVTRMNDNYDFISSVYKQLNEDVRRKRTLPPAAEWLLDNFYIIEEQVKVLRRDLNKKDYLRLPVLRTGDFKGYARIFAVAAELVAHTDGQIDENILTDYLNSYQSQNVLFDREIWSIPAVIKLALIENIRLLCEGIKQRQSQWRKADILFDDCMEHYEGDPDRIIKRLKEGLQKMDVVNPSFVEHLFYRLRRSGRSYSVVLRTIDDSLAKLGSSIENITQKEHNAQSVNTVSIGNNIKSLRYFGTLDWSDLFEKTSFVEQILKQDPCGTYSKMDLVTRNYYRSRIEEMATIYGVSEIHIANEALLLAKLAFRDSGGKCGDDTQVTRKWHVGYYLIGSGIKSLKERQEKVKNPLIKRIGSDNKLQMVLYLGSIILITCILIGIAVQYGNDHTSLHTVLLAVLIGLIALIPSSEIAVSLVNWIICKALRPAFFPRIELKEGIEESMSTIVVVPTLLPDERRVAELLNTLEGHYLANKEENLYFALIGAFKDSHSESLDDDTNIVEAALNGIRELNKKHCIGDVDKFYFYHRERQYNKKNNKWFGWERKRGALMEFNDFVLGSKSTSFSHFSNFNPPFSKVKYVITLDSDTILPIGMAKKMIGTMEHPLNNPVVDKQRGVVTEGYGIMQPRIDVDSESGGKSLFSRIFTSQGGIDPYANAISDVYQDLFGEGIFTGKGIYNLKVFQSVLKGAIPENAVLSHDLLEGSYVRTGLVTDLRLVDSFPAKYNSYSSRLHRWVRGDWQLIPFLLTRIFNSRHNKIKNPLSLLSKWKLFDNLRRSLLAPSLMVLAFLSFCILPGSIYFWIGFLVVASMFPFIMAVVKALLPPWFKYGRIKRYMPVILGLKAALFQGLVTFVFLPYQAVLMANAILVTLCRTIITKKNMLEWVTSADAEKSQKNSLGSYLLKMGVSILEALFILILAVTFKKEAVILGLLLFIFWSSAPFIAYFISKDIKGTLLKPSDEDAYELRRIARKTWRYFEEFTNTKTHYLVPDNYQEDPHRGLAYRTSPTNIGLGLLATLTARDLGYIGTYEMVDLTEKTISTIEELVKWNSHLYNWYDVRTLKPLHPEFISTVDSGNLAGYLITLEQGLTSFLHSPLVDKSFLNGIRDTLYCGGKEDFTDYENITAFETETLDLLLWNEILDKLTNNRDANNIKITAWNTKIERMMRLLRKEMEDFCPAAAMLKNIPADLQGNNSCEMLTAYISELTDLLKRNSILSDLPDVYMNADEIVDRAIEIISQMNTDDFRDGIIWLYELKDVLMQAAQITGQFINRYEGLIKRVRSLSEAMVFSPLYVKKKQLFSVGYNIEENALSDSYYDLLASEARQTSYISIARGEVPPSHWFKMGRVLTVVDRYKGLISWTGTMFEYLMPLLIMKSYKNTLLDETYSFVIKSQKKYGRQRNMPWGSSESAFNSLDINLDYQYKAIGIPWLGLKRGLIEDAVAAPYATFLALSVDPEGAIHNIKRLKKDGLDGPYGFYEAADYTPERVFFEKKRTIVKSFMAHHQGMSLLAINNYLNENIMQRRFHADAAINAARLLLQEKVPANILFAKENKEKVTPFKQEVSKDRNPRRRFGLPDSMPKAQLLSNGKYSIMITDRGTGYSKNKMVNVSRWREDRTLDPYGMFFYLKNVDTNAVWSAAYAPLNTVPDHYEVTFTPDKATFKRTDGQIETKTEVIVASEDNVEIRRISLTNLSGKSCTVEITSYFEAVLAPQADDVAHPAFSNLFVETGYQADKKCIIAGRRPKSDADKEVWLANTVVLNGDTLGDVQFETDRMRFMGRGNTCLNPVVMEGGKPLSNTVGAVLDPVMSLRVRVSIEPGKTTVISFATFISESNELLLSLVDKYASPEAIAGAFRLELTRSQVETKYLNLKASEIELYKNMIAHILFISPMRKKYQDIIMQNKKGQSSLWCYGISGDIPVVFLVLQKTNQEEILYQTLKAHEYWRLMDLSVDLVILSDEENSYELPLYTLITDIVFSGVARTILNKRGGIFILDKNKVPAEDIHLLYAVSRIILHGNAGSMEEQVNTLENNILPPKKQFTKESRQYAMPAPNEQKLLHFNDLGGFSEDGNEYVMMLEPGQNTPAPWSNVIANEKFGFLATEAGSGFTWHENSHEYKLTPWSNDAVTDSPGEVLYIGDTETGKLWTATALPIREDTPYTIRHGFGYSVYMHTSHGIEQTLSQHVPIDQSVKISNLCLKNLSKQKRKLTLTYYVQPVLGVSEQVTAMHIKTSLAPTGALLIENAYNEAFSGRICFMDVSTKERSITCDRNEFFGAGSIKAPESLGRIGLSGTVGTGFDPCGAVQISITLEPNESIDTVFLLGMATELEQVKEVTAVYCKTQNAKESLSEVKRFWKDKIDTVKVKTPTGSMDMMLNGWLQYQVISCRLWARSGFYQSGGAFGFRDQLQDCLSIANICPEIARAQILLHAKHQFIEGDVQHWWHEPQGNGTRTRFSDDRLWLPFVTAEYIRITGDSSILCEQLPFLEDSPLSELEDEKYGTPNVSLTTSSLFDHLVRAVDISLKVGEHGLPLIGTGDWNDGMNTVGNKGFGESVWLGWFLVSVLEMLLPICTSMGDDERAVKYSKIKESILKAIEKNAWDGNWYRRAYFDDGTPLGSAQGDDCKIDSIAQTWSVISEAGNPHRAKQAMDSLEDYLVNREDGLIKLLTPPFSEGELEPGYIKGYLPGVRENGGQYTHAAAWVIIAFAKLGDGDKAWELFELINPINHTGNHMDHARYKTEPYVMAADVYTVHPNIGRGGWSWYTGAAGWMYRAGLEYILGFCKNGDTIIMNPCIPSKWKEYTINYKFIDTTYNIKVKNPEGLNKGVKNLSVNGEVSPGNQIKLVNDKKSHDIEVHMGT